MTYLNLFIIYFVKICIFNNNLKKDLNINKNWGLKTIALALGHEIHFQGIIWISM